MVEHKAPHSDVSHIEVGEVEILVKPTDWGNGRGDACIMRTLLSESNPPVLLPENFTLA